MARKYTIPTAFTSERIHRTIAAASLTGLNQLFGGALALEQGAERTPLTQWTGDYFGNARMTTAEAMAVWGVTNEVPVANIAPGDPNPFFRFIDDITKTGNKINRGLSVTTMEMVNDDDMFWIDEDIGRILLLVSVGGDLDNWQVFFKVPEADYDAEVPTGFPYDEITVPDPQDPAASITRPRKWSEWQLNETHYSEPPLIDGHHYIASTRFNRHLKASEWAPFAMAGSVEVVTQLPVIPKGV